MKTIITAVTLFITTCVGLYAQSLTAPSSTTLLCPDQEYTYQFVPPSNNTVCGVNWTLTGAYELSGSTNLTTNPIKIKWKGNQATNAVGVSVVGRYASSSPNCGSSYSQTTLTRDNVVRTVYAAILSGANASPSSVSLCTANPTISFSVNAVQIAYTTGGSRPAPTNADGYEWQIPAGWKQDATNATGTVTTTSPSLVIRPNEGSGTCAGSGTMVVRAVTGSANCTTNPKTYSNPANIAFTRTPSVTVTPPAGFTGQKCGQRNNLTFTATSVSCATSYTWTLPPGWTTVSQSGNSITVTPADSGGELKATVNTGTCNIVGKYNVIYSPIVPVPGISFSGMLGGYEWCNYESFTFIATPPSGYPNNFGFDWNATGGITINGGGSPLHNTTNSVTIAVPGSVYGTQTIAVRMNNGTCAPSNYQTYTRKVAVYANNEFSIIGPNEYCPNTAVDFLSSIIGGSVTGYQWTAPTGWSASGHSTPYFHVSLPGTYTSGAVTLRLQNRCGWTNTPYVLNFSNNCSFRIAMSPNPAGSVLTVSDLDTEGEVKVQLVDKDQRIVFKGAAKDGKIEIDVSKLPNGTYILTVTQRGKTESERIIINH